MKSTATGLREHSPTRAVTLVAAALLVILTFAAIPFPASGSPPSFSVVADDLIRPCKTSDAPSQSKSKGPKQTKAKGYAGEQSPGVCVEVRSEILEVQEILQAKIRELRWNIHDEILNESSWLFLRDLDVNELLAMTQENKRPREVEWKSGSVTVRVTTTDAGEGFTRTNILAQFRGIGETTDKLMMQHEWWPLESNGALEESLMEAIRKHFVRAGN